MTTLAFDSHGWQLTRRGRFVFRGLPLLTLCAFLVLSAFALLCPQAAQAGNAEMIGDATRIVTVSQGQTLWDIALVSAPQEDARDVIHEIMELNQLESSSIVTGQELEVPVYSEK